MSQNNVQETSKQSLFLRHHLLMISFRETGERLWVCHRARERSSDAVGFVAWVEVRDAGSFRRDGCGGGLQA